MSSSTRSTLERKRSSALSPRKPDVSIAVCRPIAWAPARILPGEGDLHHRLAARDGEPAVERAQRRTRTPRAGRAPARPRRRCRPSGARYPDCGSRCSASRQPDRNSTTRQPGPVVARRRSRRSGRSRRRLPRRADPPHPARRATARRADRGGCRLEGAGLRPSRALDAQIWPWNVRLITSCCCSLVSRTKLTA